MAIKVGDKVTKASVIDSFHETVKTNIYQNFPVNQTNLPRKLPMISYAFNNPNATNLVNYLSGQPVAAQVATMYQNFINLVSTAKVIYYYETHGNWTNGGRLTYTTDFQTTYKGTARQDMPFKFRKIRRGRIVLHQKQPVFWSHFFHPRDVTGRIPGVQPNLVKGIQILLRHHGGFKP